MSPGNKFKIRASIEGVLNTTQFAFWPCMGIEDLENMAKESLTEALDKYLDNLKINSIKVKLT